MSFRAGQLVELLPQVDAQHRVEADGGFIEHQQVGAATSAHASDTRVR